jgi:hypothetical protein
MLARAKSSFAAARPIVVNASMCAASSYCRRLITIGHTSSEPSLCHWDCCVYFKTEEDYPGLMALGLVTLPFEVVIRRLPGRGAHSFGSAVPMPAEGGEHEPDAG